MDTVLTNEMSKCSHLRMRPADGRLRQSGRTNLLHVQRPSGNKIEPILQEDIRFQSTLFCLPCRPPIKIERNGHQHSQRIRQRRFVQTTFESNQQ